MADVSDISNKLDYYDKKVMVKDDHDTNDIIKAIKKYHPKNCKQYDKIADMHWRGNAHDTAAHLWRFLKKNVKYNVEHPDDQTVKTPGAILHQGYGDCKHYASYIVGVCDALRRMGKPIQAHYRFTADLPGLDVHHVFAVVKDGQSGEAVGYRNNMAKQWGADKIHDYAHKNGLRLVHGYETEARVSGTADEIYCDPVLTSFNSKPSYYNIKDVHVMPPICEISGTGGVGLNSGAQYLVNQRADMMQNAAQDARQGANLLRDASEPWRMFKGNEGAHDLHTAEHLLRDASEPWRMLRHHHHHHHGNGQHHPVHRVSGDGVGKKKHNNIFKKLGKDVMKVEHLVLNVAGSPARNAFLALVDLNLFNLAMHLYNSLHDPNKGPKVEKLWHDIGGNPKKFANAIANGYKLYKKKHHISGYYCGSSIGQVTPALVALASSIVAAFSKYMDQSASEKKQQADAATKGAAHLAKNASAGINAANGDFGEDGKQALQALTQGGPMMMPDGTQVASPGTMNMSTSQDANGNPVLTVHSADSDILNAAGTADGGAANVITPDAGGGVAQDANNMQAALPADSNLQDVGKDASVSAWGRSTRSTRREGKRRRGI